MESPCRRRVTAGGSLLSNSHRSRQKRPSPWLTWQRGSSVSQLHSFGCGGGICLVAVSDRTDVGHGFAFGRPADHSRPSAHSGDNHARQLIHVSAGAVQASMIQSRRAEAERGAPPRFLCRNSEPGSAVSDRSVRHKRVAAGGGSAHIRGYLSHPITAEAGGHLLTAPIEHRSIRDPMDLHMRVGYWGSSRSSRCARRCLIARMHWETMSGGETRPSALVDSGDLTPARGTSNLSDDQRIVTLHFTPCYGIGIARQ